MSAVYIQLGPQYVCVTLTFGHFFSFSVSKFYNDLFISDYFSIMGPPFLIEL